MRKTKEKPKRKQKPIHSFLNRHFEFVSPLPLEDCVGRLQDRTEHGIGLFTASYDYLTVKLTPFDIDTYEFHIKRIIGHNMIVQLNGRLERYEGQNTLISGHTKIAPVSWIFFLIPAVGFVVTMTWLHLYFVIPLLLVAFALMWIVFLLTPRNGLVYLLHELLRIKNQ